MDRKKLIECLPPVVTEIKEMQMIMSANQLEIDKLSQAAEDALKEGFLFTQGMYAAARWEKILGLYPKGTDTLEDRTRAITVKTNEKLPFTIRVLKKRLYTMVGYDECQISRDIDNYLLTVNIRGHTFGELEAIRNMIYDMIPATMILNFGRKEEASFEEKINIESKIKIMAGFYPFKSIPKLLYDGTTHYNGQYQYKKAKTGELIDLHPMKIGVKSEVFVKNEHCYKLSIREVTTVSSKAKTGIKLRGDTKLAIKQESSLSVKTKVIVPTKYIVKLKIGYHLSEYNGTHKYDGTRRYDSEIIDEVL